MHLTERYDAKTVRQIAEVLLAQLKKARNEDSKFSVASVILFLTEDEEILIKSGVNVEISGRCGANCCAERNIIHDRRAEGRNMVILDVINMGVDITKTYSSQEGRTTPSCFMCVEEIYQFRSRDPGCPTVISQMPLCLPTVASIEKAVKNIISEKIDDIVPDILKHDVEESYKYLNRKKPRGIFRVENLEMFNHNIEKHYRRLFPNLNISELPHLPLNGDITLLAKKANIELTGENVNTSENLTKINSLLAIVRNIHASRNFDEDKKALKPNLAHIEATICSTTDGRVFLGSSLGGRNISKQESSIHKAFSLAQAEDHNHKVTHQFTMGDRIIKERNRQMPLISELYETGKRAVQHVNAEGKLLPDIQIHCLAPSIPGTIIYPDHRDLENRRTKDAPFNIVTLLRFPELISPSSLYITAKQSREL